MSLLNKVHALTRVSEVGTEKAHKVSTMRTATPDTSEFLDRVEHKYSRRNPNPTTMRREEEEENTKLVTATLKKLADSLNMSLADFVSDIEKATVLAKDWAKTKAEDPNFREEVKDHPVKNQGIFEESSEKIASYFANSKVSSSLGQAIKKLNWYLVRGGQNIPSDKRSKVKRAIQILQKKNGDNK